MPEVLINYPPDLPVSLRRDDILAALRANQVVVIAGATGSGKTTQLPKMCLELGRESIAHTQPRRIAARSVAERISQELKVDLGDLVGYQVRFTDKASAKTKIKVMTDGILLNAIQNDPLLKRYDTVIIDEAHERSLNIDFLLGYLKRLLPKRPDLKLIITSATIDPESFSRHFDDAPIIEVSGRSYPIEIRYRPVSRDLEAETDADVASSADDYIDGVIKALEELQKEPVGDVLVFLSGESEIKDCQDALNGRITQGVITATEVLPLYGRLSASEQHKIFEPSKLAGIKRRIILATNVAETSLTIPNIKYVVDAGTARISRYSARAKVQRLPIEAISQASANQRAGRAGRTSAGVVIRLYSEEDYTSRSEFTDPEILRTNLASVILQAASLGIDDIAHFPFLQAPDPKGIKDGLGLLWELGAVNSKDREVSLTKIGRDIARLPIEPRFARMLIEAKKYDLVREVMVIVSGLTIQDPRERPLEKRPQADLSHARFTDPSSDFLTLLNLWNHLEDQQKKLSSSAFRRLCKAEYLNYLRIREWQDLMRQLASIAKPLGLECGPRRKNPDGIHKSLLAGLLSQIGILLPSEKKIRIKGEFKQAKATEYQGISKKFVIFPGSTLYKKPPPAIMSAELVETSRLFARMNAQIDPAWVEEIAPELCATSVSEPHWEKKLGAVIGYQKLTLFGLVIVQKRKVQYSKTDPMLCRELFIRHALVDGEWDSRQKFETKNRELIALLEQEADRTRNPLLVPDENALYSFFNNRIPLDVLSTRSFEGWWREQKQEKPELLTMTRENLFEAEARELDENQYPGTASFMGQEFSLSYKFLPGAIDDGLTVIVPLALLPRLEPGEFEWLVPGMREELVTELLRSLPKSIRRNVVPAADWAKKLLPEIANPQGLITVRLAAVIQDKAGVKVMAGDFEIDKLPPGVRPSYQVVDAKGRELAIDIDLEALKERFAEKGRKEVASIASVVHHEIERDGIKTWDFGELPQIIETKANSITIKAYPALTATPAGVAIKVYSTPDQQLQNHPFGLIALIRAQIPNPAQYVEGHIKPQEKLAVAACYPALKHMVDDVISALADKHLRILEPNGMVFSKAQFESVRDQVQKELLETSFKVVEELARIAVSAKKARDQISSARAIDFLAELAEEKTHISQLQTAGIIFAAGLSRLPRIPVYLNAIALRIEKLQQNPERDRVARLELGQALKSFEAAGGQIPLDQSAAKSLHAARWLLEELRVSLFAQTLGTAEPVSLKRIQKVLAGD